MSSWIALQSQKMADINAALVKDGNAVPPPKAIDFRDIEDTDSEENREEQESESIDDLREQLKPPMT